MNTKGFFSNWIVKNLIWAAVVVFAIIIGTSILLKVITFHGQELIVPDFTNLTVQEAGVLASASDMRIDVTDSVYVRRMARGAVYRQNPVAGSKVKKGRRIMLTINSVVPKKVSMPNLIGYSMRQAKAELLSRGLKLGKLIYVNDIATNNVLRQLHGNREIQPGKQIESETEIDLVVGLNSTDKETYVPNVTGMKMLTATDAIHDNSLNIKRYVFDKDIKTYADSLNALVYKQVPSASELSVVMGTDVTLYLRLGQ